jgi:hypothetical protein
VVRLVYRRSVYKSGDTVDNFHLMRNERNFKWSVRSLAIGALVVVGLYVAPSYAQAFSMTNESFVPVYLGSNIYDVHYVDSLSSFLCPGGYNNNSGNGNLISFSLLNATGTVVTSFTGPFCQNGLPIFDSYPVQIDSSSLYDGSWYFIFGRTAGGGYAADDYIRSDFTVVSHVISGFVLPDISTHFISLSPVPSSIVSSSSPVTVGADLYINPSDYNSDQYLNITFSNDTVEAIGGSVKDAWDSLWGLGSTGGYASIKIPLVSGLNSVSTTTNNFIRDGRVHVKYQVVSPSFWNSLWFIGGAFQGDTLISTTTTFIVGEKTDFDIASDLSGAGVANTILFGTTTAGISTSTLEAITSSCAFWNPINFNIFGCFKGLILPSSEDFKSQIVSLRNDVFDFFPFGYLTRFLVIASNLAPIEPPELSYTFGSSSPSVLQGTIVSFQIYDYMGSSSPIGEIRTDDGQNKSLWDIIDPPVTTLTSIMVLFVILDDLLGFGIGRFNKGTERREGKQKIYQKSITNDVNDRRYPYF